MASHSSSADIDLRATVAVVGGGPVGLLLALRLTQLGIHTTVLERAEAPAEHSRAIGIHAPSLELLDELGVVEGFLAAGVKVPGGVAQDGEWELGRLTFDQCPEPYTYALSLPQDQTETLLEGHLRAAAPGALQRGVEVTAVQPDDEGVTLRCQRPGDEPLTLRAEAVVGCDGKNSLVRSAAKIPFDGAPYPDTFVMGDFADNTDFGPLAYLFLSSHGLVESFPLPGAKRRWVLKTERYHDHPERQAFCAEVLRRTGHDLADAPHTMLGPFGIQHYLAARYARGRLALAGDAAHVMSPIGGQGMNTGWRDAWELAAALERALRGGEALEPALAHYSEVAHERGSRVIRRAAFNTMMGRKSALAPLRNALVWAALRTPARHRMARVFSMRGL